MNDELLKYMVMHNINDGILREFLFKDKMEAAKEQVHKTYDRYNKILIAIEELNIFIHDKDVEEK